MAPIDITLVLSVVIRTSHQRTASQLRTNAMLLKCPLFGGSTVVLRIMKVQDEFTYTDTHTCQHLLTYIYSMNCACKRVRTIDILYSYRNNVLHSAATTNLHI